jgi:segregation and condensation protein A
LTGSAAEMGDGSASGADHSLSAFTVELDVYSGPYEGLLALILREELEIFEVPLAELVNLYRSTEGLAEGCPGALERDTDFVDSATSLVLLKGRSLVPAGSESGEEDGEEAVSPEELEARLILYLKVRRAAEALGERLSRNAGYYPSGHAPAPKPGQLRIKPEKISAAARRTFSRTVEPEVRHLGPITVTVGDLVAMLRRSLSRGEPVSFEDLTRNMDRLRSAVAFAAALSLASEGSIVLVQPEPLGPLTLRPAG